MNWTKPEKQVFVPLSCECSTKELRMRVIKGGGVQYRQQCVICGRSGNAVKRKSGGSEGDVPSYDESLMDEWEKRRSKAYEVYETQTAADWTDWYARYLNSETWRTISLRVRERDEICQGCLDAPAEVAHHLTYAHVGQELLFELVGICRNCHDRAHGR